jgi:hypothetical protein
MLTSIDIVFYRPQNRIPYIMIVETPLREKDTYMAWMPAYKYSPQSIQYDIDGPKALKP